ncbi:hypothetical protein [Micromonospora cathayae]|uniref:Uncharacterized protein n=1 Tax=Micromonospora cathayae TaxID=3028804 RepID=A0ABY7ZRH3_9ACTN|nr:hypothetical protein [Micromonospora sp. HUAS 3]WDZ85627.1 hypothetical protein PVK37_04020 [Micromonospora sp. HUAS 3]
MTPRTTMPSGSDWRDVKARVRAAHPDWDSVDRVARRARFREQLLASVNGVHLGDTDKHSDVG